jgi:hypothetical protein
MDKTKARTFNLKIVGSVIGSYKTYQTEEVLFTVNVVDKCVTAIISTTSIGDFQYNILSKSSTYIQNIDSHFSLSENSDCPPITLHLYDISTAIETNYDANVFT